MHIQSTFCFIPETAEDHIKHLADNLVFVLNDLFFILASEQRNDVFIKAFIHANFSCFLYFYILPYK